MRILRDLLHRKSLARADKERFSMERWVIAGVRGSVTGTIPRRLIVCDSSVQAV
ncbi:hypothetical protein RISK_000182 [Rhodopirellula islandica]|uniref:Uncharacterized protein n=1 Tax=Rhodopirellula islandica TaxID=595434 RepID=A0A0J1EQP6_RHOIS|nr:hypothetical protein RISK_000182 [Rhodopirellula islandica]